MVYSNMFKAVSNQLSMTQEQLAKESKVSFAIVSGWENSSPMTKKIGFL